MANLTKKNLEQVLSKRISPIEKLLKQNTAILRQTTALMTHLVQNVDELKTDMKSAKATVDSHTVTLDSIYKNTGISKAENASLNSKDWNEAQTKNQFLSMPNLRILPKIRQKQISRS